MEIKQYLTELPILASLGVGDTLYLYLAVLEASVSAALLNQKHKEEENRKHKLIFLVSKSLFEAEAWYTHLEQAALALRVAIKKLRPYFQAHPIVVLTNLPFRSTIHKLDLSGRMARWAIELSEFGIQYKPRLALKRQILVDFLAELPQPNVDQGNAGWWILNVDAASHQTRARVSLQFKAPIGERIEQAIWLDFPMSNNETKYEAILARVNLAKFISS